MSRLFNGIKTINRGFILQRLLVLAALVCFQLLESRDAWAEGVDLEISFSGVDREIEANITSSLSLIREKKVRSLTVSRVRQLYSLSQEEIVRALQPYGFYRPLITSTLDELQSDSWHIHYEIDLRDPLYITSATIQVNGPASEDSAFQVLVASLPTQEGETLNHLDYEKSKGLLMELATQRGYFDAKLTRHKVEVNLQEYEAKVELLLESGPRNHYGEVRLLQDFLAPDLVEGFLHFGRGKPYLYEDLIELQQSLSQSGYFQSSEVWPLTEQRKDGEVPIEVLLEARKRHRYEFGIGYGSDTGARGSFGWQMPYINRNGHRLMNSLRVSEIGSLLKSAYRIPILDPSLDHLTLSGSLENEMIDERESTLKKLDITFEHSRGLWREEVKLSYELENYQIGIESGSSRLLLPGITWRRIWGEDRGFSDRGLRFELGLRAADKDLLADSTFAQVRVGLKVIQGLLPDTRAILRSDYGYTWIDELFELPTSVRYFTGGSQSVRGFSYQSIGPVDESGVGIGGKYLFNASIELEQRLQDKWTVALFYDAGWVADQFSHSFERGIGAGVRWHSPLGTIRFDFAQALTLDDRPWRVHLNIGPEL